jgi:hypothetical protein
MGISKDNNSNKLTITGENADIQKTKDPTQTFQKPVHLGRVEGQKVPRNVTFYESEYDLFTIANARQLDGIINRAVGVFKEQILKNGFQYVSKDDKAQKYIRKRIREIELFTNIKHKEIMSTVADQLVTYANAYVIKVRKNISKYGKRYKLYNKTLKPIVGLFVAEATTMSIGLDPSSNTKKYKQTIAGNEKYFNVEDVIHLTYNKIPGTLTGLSNINQVLDDVRALRKLEEEIEILGFQYAIPLYLYQVGTDAVPAAPGEVDAAAAVVNNAPTYGMMVVPHTHEVKAVTSSGDSVDVMKFVEHFKKRIFAGLGVSPISMAETNTSNRNTSEIADIQMQTITKSHQQILSNKFEQEFIDELLRDGKFSPLLIESELRFGEIDLEAKVKKEDHILGQYQGNLITWEEARLQGDKEPKANEKDLYLNRVQIPLLQAEAKAAAAANPNTTTSSSKAKKTATASKNRTTNKNKPTNQHGSSTRPKIKRDNLDELCDYSVSLGKKLFSDSGHKSKLNRDKYVNKIYSRIKDEITKQLRYTINSYKTYYHDDSKFDESMTSEVVNYVNVIVKNKVDNIGKIKGSLSSIKLDYSLESIAEAINITDKIENLAKIIILKNKGYPGILYKSDNCDRHSDWEMNLKTISMEKIPPLGYSCNCEVEEIE